jgi:hypothetical protein
VAIDYTHVTSSDQVEIDQDLDFQSHKAVNVSNPTSPQDAATKSYIDAAIAALTFLTSSNFVFNEALAGTGATRTLVNPPTAGTQQVYKNGLLLTPGVGKDYTISGAVITFAVAPKSSDKLLAHYMK